MKINILSFDLGNNLGVALSQYNTKTKENKVIKTKLFCIDQYINDHNFIIDNITNRNSIKILAFKSILHNDILKMINNYKINIFITEDIFIYPGRLTAYKSLALYINALDEYINFYYHKDLLKISPKYIKYKFSSVKRGNASKADMKIALSALMNITTNININNLSEHEIDAIAVAYVYISEIVKINYI